MYDVSKENDKNVLRAWAKHLQEELLFSKKENIQLRKQRIEDEELCKKLAEELLLMKKRIFDSKQEKKENKARNQKKKRRKGNLPVLAINSNILNSLYFKKLKKSNHI